MVEMTNITYAIDTSVITAVLPSTQPKIHVLMDKQEQNILLQDRLAELPFPTQIKIKDPEPVNDIGASGVVILPLTGGGRGPIINYGEVVSVGLLKTLLANNLSEDEFTDALRLRLDNIPFLRQNDKGQTGFATHRETITLDHDWSGYPPKIELELSHGELINIIQTQVGVDPDCITYVEIPPQEVIFGHSGIVLDKQFTVYAAILAKTTPTIVNLNWSPAPTVGPPITSTTTESAVQNTTTNCMGFKVKGTLGLSSTLPYEVSGTMYAQVSFNSGPWVNIASMFWRFGEPGNVEKTFDVFIAQEQRAHAYKFRGYLVVDSSAVINRELIGFITIDTVTESGSGEILSNDLQIKWTSKE